MIDASWQWVYGQRMDNWRLPESQAARDEPGQPAVPNLVTDVPTMHAAVPDVVMTPVVHDSLDAAGLLPGEHAAVCGCVSADLLVSSRRRGITLIGPLLADTSVQARAGGYTTADFAIDWDRRQATCPHGTVSSRWAPMRQRDGKEAISVKFAAATSRARDKCITAKWTGRHLFLRPREIHEAVAARAGQDTRHWKDQYRTRAGVEGLMHQATCVTSIRRAAADRKVGQSGPMTCRHFSPNCWYGTRRRSKGAAARAENSTAAPGPPRARHGARAPGYMFLSPGGSHYRRSTFGERYFHPAAAPHGSAAKRRMYFLEDIAG